MPELLSIKCNKCGAALDFEFAQELDTLGGIVTRIHCPQCRFGVFVRIDQSMRYKPAGLVFEAIIKRYRKEELKRLLFIDPNMDLSVCPKSIKDLFETGEGDTEDYERQT